MLNINEYVCEHETWLRCILKIDGLCELFKIDELSELMNYGMLTCSWLYDDDKVMNNG